MSFSRLNILTGWSVWLIVVVYLLTVEPTSSFWDYGEFIASDITKAGPARGAPLQGIARSFMVFAFLKLQHTQRMLYLLGVVVYYSVLVLEYHHLGRRFFGGFIAEPQNLVSYLGSGIIGFLLVFSDSFCLVQQKVRCTHFLHYLQQLIGL